VLHVGRSVTLLDTDQHEEAGADLAGDAVVHGDAGRSHSLYDGPHEGLVIIKGTSVGSAATASVISPRGFRRRSRRCRGMTLPSALIIDALTLGCSRSSSTISRLTRWRCRLRSPHAGQQHPMI